MQRPIKDQITQHVKSFCSNEYETGMEIRWKNRAGEGNGERQMGKEHDVRISLYCIVHAYCEVCERVGVRETFV